MEDYNSKTRAQLFDIIKQLGLKAPSASAKKQILVDILSSANTVPLGSIQVDANQGIAPSVEPLSCIELDLVSSDEVSHQHSKVVKSDDISCLEQVQDLPFENEPSENATEIIIQDLATTESSNIPSPPSPLDYLPAEVAKMLSSSNITTWTQIEALNHSSLEPILIKQPLIMTAMKLIKESGFAPNFDSRITIDACKFNDLVGDLVKMHLKETSAVKTTIKPVIKETSAVKTTIKPVSKLAAPTKVPAFDDKKRPALKRPPILFKSGLGQVDSSK